MADDSLFDINVKRSSSKQPILHVFRLQQSTYFWKTAVYGFCKTGLVVTKMNSKIPKGQKEIVKSDRQEHGQQNKTKNKHRTHDTTLKTKAGITRTLQKLGWDRVLWKVKQLLFQCGTTDCQTNAVS